MKRLLGRLGSFDFSSVKVFVAVSSLRLFVADVVVVVVVVVAVAVADVVRARIASCSDSSGTSS